MAARLNLRHQQMVRDKMQVIKLIARLQSYIDGEIELSQGQVRAIEILLRKSLPDLAALQVDGDGDGGPIKHHWTTEAVSAAPPVSGDT